MTQTDDRKKRKASPLEEHSLFMFNQNAKVLLSYGTKKERKKRGRQELRAICSPLASRNLRVGLSHGRKILSSPGRGKGPGILVSQHFVNQMRKAAIPHTCGRAKRKKKNRKEGGEKRFEPAMIPDRL